MVGHYRILARSVGLVDPKECLLGGIVGQYRHMWSAGSSEGWGSRRLISAIVWRSVFEERVHSFLLVSSVECASNCLALEFEPGVQGGLNGALNFAEPLRLPEYPPPAVAVKWPPEWCERYFKRKYHKIDPVVRRTPTLSRPFLWDQLAEQYQLQPDERRVLDEAREAGLKHGMSVPLFGPLGRLSVVSFASRFDDADPQHSKGHLNALAWHFHTACVEITRPAEDNCNMRVALSQRELDCLRWVAEGKSSWEIGRILQISENTVNFHLKNAMRKLGATSRIQAVIVAIRLNLIFDVHAA